MATKWECITEPMLQFHVCRILSTRQCIMFSELADYFPGLNWSALFKVLWDLRADRAVEMVSRPWDYEVVVKDRDGLNARREMSRAVANAGN